MSASKQVLVEGAEIGQGIGVGEGRHHENQAIGLADHGHAGRVAFVFAAQAGRIDDFDVRYGDFFGMVQIGELLQSRVGNRGHPALPGVRQGRIGRHARQPVKQRALARALVSDKSDFHDGILREDNIKLIANCKMQNAN